MADEAVKTPEAVEFLDDCNDDGVLQAVNSLDNAQCAGVKRYPRNGQNICYAKNVRFLPLSPRRSFGREVFKQRQNRRIDCGGSDK